MRHLLACLLALLPLAAGAQDLSVNGLDVRVTAPPGPTEGLSILMVLSGGGGRAPALPPGDYITVVPSAGGDQWADGRTGTEDGPGVAHLLAVIDAVVARTGADPKRVFVTGVSNGGIMAWRMACEASDRIAGIAPVAANMTRDGAFALTDCDPWHPVAVLSIQGTADRLSPYAGGNSAAAGLRGTPTRMASARESVIAWLGINGCAAAAGRRSGSTTAWDFPGCDAPVRYIELAGQGHGWPASAGREVVRFFGGLGL